LSEKLDCEFSGKEAEGQDWVTDSVFWSLATLPLPAEFEFRDYTTACSGNFEKSEFVDLAEAPPSIPEGISTAAASLPGLSDRAAGSF